MSSVAVFFPLVHFEFSNWNRSINLQCVSFLSGVFFCFSLVLFVFYNKNSCTITINFIERFAAPMERHIKQNANWENALVDKSQHLYWLLIKDSVKVSTISSTQYVNMYLCFVHRWSCSIFFLRCNLCLMLVSKQEPMKKKLDGSLRFNRICSSFF